MILVNDININKKEVIQMDLTPKQIRMMLGMTQKEMAEKLGITVMTLYRKENKESKWSLLEIEEISRLSNIPKSQIITD